MLLRPKRPLPRRFNRRVTPTMRSFAARRHQRTRGRSRERLRKWWRQTSGRIAGVGAFLRRWWLWGVLGLCVAAIILALFSPVLRVREIRIQRTQGRVDVASIQRSLSPLFGKHLLLVTAREIEEVVEDVVPDLDSIDIRKDYPSRLFLRITLKPLVARLVIDDPATQNQKTASGSVNERSGLSDVPQFDYLTENGMYVATANAESGSALRTMRIVDWAVRPVPSTPLLTAEFLQRMEQTERVLTQEFGYGVRSRSVYVRAQEYHLSIGKIELWFDLQSPLAEQLARYRTFLQSVPLKDVGRYVDLRLAGRVVYR